MDYLAAVTLIAIGAGYLGMIFEIEFIAKSCLVIGIMGGVALGLIGIFTL